MDAQASQGTFHLPSSMEDFNPDKFCNECSIFDSLCTIFSYSFFVVHGYSCSIFYKHIISQIHINITDYCSIIEIITCLKNND